MGVEDAFWATARYLDRYPAELSYCLNLMVGFEDVEVDHCGRLTAMGGVWPRVM